LIFTEDLIRKGEKIRHTRKKENEKYAYEKFSSFDFSSSLPLCSHKKYD
jgi:hypothetical protein